MRTYVITGGTDGMGRGLGLHLLGRGDRVVSVASGERRGRVFLAEAEAMGAAERATFIPADLSTLAGMRAVVAQVSDEYDRVDGLVLAAQRFRPEREETCDGLEFTFALAYLSRAVIGAGLLERLEAAPAGVIVNIAGPGGLPGKIHWNDLQLLDGYRGMLAAMQSSRANDLLGADFPARYWGARTRYVLYDPGFVRTGMADPLPRLQRMATKVLAALLATPVHKAVKPIVAVLGDPVPQPLSAWRRHRRLDISGADFDPDAALRLRQVTDRILTEIKAYE